jgi:hypothetical protein
LRWNKHAFCYVDDQVEGILWLHSDYVYHSKHRYNQMK